MENKTFEWDERKSKINKTKHGVDFEAAVRLFDSPFIRLLDSRFDYGEDRWVALGTIGHRFLLIVFTERSSTIRIISARKARKHEIKTYFEKTKGRLD
jgi:uncharacterized DUF497 family protein